MPLNAFVRFQSSAASSSLVDAGLVVRRYELREAMSEPFALTLDVLSTNPALAEDAFVGQPAEVLLSDEPFVREVTGIVRRMEQHTAVPGGTSQYTWTIVPPVWLTTRRRDCRIFQHLSVPEIVDAVLAGPTYGGRVPAPVKHLGAHPPHEYVVQYDESDWEFLSRILADAGIASYFDHTSGSAWTLVDDTTAAAPDITGGPVRFADLTAMHTVDAANTRIPHVLTAAVVSNVETSAVTLRDYDFEKPQLLLQAQRAVEGGAAFTNEADLEAYGFEVGRFATKGAGAARARVLLEADRGAHRRVRCTTSFALPPGTRMTMVDHPRDDLGVPLLVVQAHSVVDGDGIATHELLLMELSRRFRPARRPKARILGTQTAFVVGAAGEEIDVDRYGRVEVEFRWDRRDLHTGGTSRRVRVAQAWAGAGFGFVALPRVGEEVIVAYLDGDPDEPILVGRVHNALVASPLSLPAQKAVSVWRSSSTPGGAGYNQILMDDSAGAERMEMHAQRDMTEHVGKDAHRSVVGNQTGSVGGNGGTSVSGDKSLTVGGTLSVSAGAEIDVSAPAVNVTGSSTVHITAGGERLDQSGNHIVRANAMYIHGKDVVQVVGARFHVFCDEIVLKTAGAKITMSGGDISIEASGTVDVRGGLIKLN